VIKILKPVRAKKIKREIIVLGILSDSEDIIKLLDQVIDNSTRTPSLIMEYFEHQDFRTIWPMLKQDDIKIFMYQLLRGLDYAH